MTRLAKMAGVLVAALLTVALVNFVANSEWLAHQSQVEEPETRYDAVIRRDQWGVPHILGRTDADAAFGLAYAHAEDDFATIQEVLAMSRGRLGELTGPDGAAQDYTFHLLGVRPRVEARYERDISGPTRALLAGYADGLNLYAARHSDEIRLRNLFPVSGEDVATGFAFSSPFFFGLDRTLSALAESRDPPRDSGPATERGSNAFAVAPSRAPDGATRLIVNSHQPWTGPVAWYEAHVTSEEGLDFMGGLFPGSPVPLLGHNRHLGWANTVNRPDLIDVYRLELNADGDRYRYDGRWLPLEQRRIWLHVRFGPFVVPVPETVRRSVHGPVIVNDNGAFAIRYAGIGEIRQVEQYYRLVRAESYEEWLDAMRMRAIAATNFVYADETGRIAYLYNARLPARAPDFDWRGVLPGDTSQAVWRRYAAFEAQPLYENPPSGFLFNANNTPCVATAPEDNLDCDAFPPELGVETHTTNRMWRAWRLLTRLRTIGPEELARVKYDTGYARRSAVGRFIERIVALETRQGSDLDTARRLLARWDWNLDGRGRADALTALVIRPVARSTYFGDPLPEPRQVLADAAEWLRDHRGRIDPPLGSVIRLRHGDADLPLTGGPDALRAIYWHDEDGLLVTDAGDSYIMWIEWDAAGRVSSRSVHQFGAATTRYRSRHYADQAPLFARQEMKPTWFAAEELRRHVACRYRPGEAARTRAGRPCPL